MAIQWSGLSPELLLRLDRGGDQPLRSQLEAGLRDAIRSGRLQGGERLPSSRELSRELGVSRGLVQECYSQLLSEGYLTSQVGSATRVAAGAYPAPAASAASAAAPRPVSRPRLIADFRIGVPDLASFPRGDWVWATREACGRVATADLDYGDPRGSAALRRVLAGYLRRVRAAAADQERMIVCAGFAQGLRPMGSPPPLSASETPRAPLRIVFMGTPPLAAHILDRLIGAAGPDFVVAGVVTRPDQPRKRGLKLEPSEVGAIAERARLPTLKPTKIRTPEFLAELKAFEPDLLVVAAYGRMLPNPVLEAPRLMPINVHASLLPRHRGAAPIEGAILAGDRESGVTIMRVIERMDAGPILLQRAIALAADETQGTLKEKLAELGASALLEAIAQFRDGTVIETPQDESLATYTAPIEKAHSVIDWSVDAVQIERMVRAYDPWPVARTTIAGEDLLIWRAAAMRTEDSRGNAAGSLCAHRDTRHHHRAEARADRAMRRGSLALIEVQAPGRRRMAAADYLRGRRVAAGMRLGT